MKPGILILFLLFVSHFVSAQKDTNSKIVEGRVRQLMNDGGVFLSKGNYVMAYQSFSKGSSLAQTSLDSTSFVYLWTEEILAMWLHDVGFIKEAIERQERILSLLEKSKIPNKLSYGIGIRGSIAGWYIESGDYERALFQFKKNLELSDKPGRPTDASQHNNLGWCYLQMKNYDAALAQFRITLANLNRYETAYDFHFSVYDNLGDLFSEKAEYEKALTYYTKCADLAKAHDLGLGRTLQFHFKFARVFLRQRNYEEAEKELLMLDKLLRVQEGTNNEYDVKVAELWYTLSEATGRKAEALSYYKKWNAIKESIRTSKDLAREDVMNMMVEQNLSELNLRLKYEQGLRERKEQDLLISENKQQFNLYFAVWISVLSIILIVTGQIVYKNRSRKAKAISEKLEISNQLKESELHVKQLEQEKLEVILESKRKDISEMSLLVQSLRKLQSELSVKVRNIKKISPSDQANELKRVIAEIHASIENSQKASHLQERIEDVNQEFYGNLHEKHPDLTKSEIEMCALIRVNMRSNEIASLKNMILTSVKQSKRRLRRKMGLEEHADLYDYLKGF